MTHPNHDANGFTFVPATVREHEWLTPAAESFEDAHQHWHDAADAYHDPPRFRRTVDALIQAARNVTFRLQAAKAEGPESFEWYEGDHEDSWQAFMRSVPEMVWLRDARTEVTKRKGLSRTSFAIVSLVEGYLEPTDTLLKLPADLPTPSLVERAVAGIPAEFRPHQAVEVVRRWEVTDFSGEELLGVLRHCLHILDGLLLYAAEVSGGRSPEIPSEFVRTVEVPRCMIPTPDLVALTFEADTLDQVAFGLRKEEATEEGWEAAVKRYGGKKKLDAIESDTFEGFARRIHEGSRIAFKKDGAVLPFAFLRSGGGDWTPFGTLAEGKRDKYMMWRNLGILTLINGYDAVVHTGEMWFAPSPKDPTPYLDVSTQPGVKEILATIYEERDGTQGVIASRIHRLGPVAVLGKPGMEFDVKEMVFLEPIRRAWNMRQDDEMSADEP